MQYRQFGRMAEKVSALGFGAMRMPMAGGEIDEPEAIRMIRRAIDGGVNYVDTAYFYHDGKSESLVGKALKDGYREKTYVATKSPIGLHKCPEDFDRCLETQLERLDIGTIDFYLMHALDRGGWDNVAVPFGLIDKMEKAKADGKIRHIGFSFHDDFDTFRRIIDSYDGWEFCQIQFNYIDIDHQAGLRGLEYAAAKGLGVIVMEPLLSGKLASPVPGVQRVLTEGTQPVGVGARLRMESPGGQPSAQWHEHDGAGRAKPRLRFACPARHAHRYAVHHVYRRQNCLRYNGARPLHQMCVLHALPIWGGNPESGSRPTTAARSCPPKRRLRRMLPWRARRICAAHAANARSIARSTSTSPAA